jgi:putative uncharacterized protein gbs1341
MTDKISEKNKQLELDIQKNINRCLDNFESFCFDAGAGAGKTYALQKSIEHILKTKGKALKQNNQKILCITYTNAAKDEILDRLGKNSSVIISTIHEFLWGFIAIQQELLMIEHERKIKGELNKIEQKINSNALSSSVTLADFQAAISDEKFLEVFYNTPSSPAEKFKSMIKEYNEYFSPYLSNVKTFSSLVKIVIKKYKLEQTLKQIEDKKSKQIIYNPIQNQDKLEKYVISHDTLLLYSKNIITSQNILKRLFSDRYPYVLVDEYQDTDKKVIDIIDSIRTYASSKKKFMVSFFGDSLQNIYETGVGILPKKNEYQIIEKKFNRRSSKKIVELIEKIRNDNFGQQSIYTDFDNGSYKFYVANDNFDLDIFLQKNNLTNNTACLLMKNDDITKARGFDKILTVLKSFPRFSGKNYENMTNEFLQKNLQHMGWFLRDILTFIDFIQKIENDNSTVREIVQFITPYKSTLTFAEMQKFISSLRKINLSTLTINKCINEIINIKGRISGEKILRNIFSIDDMEKDILINIKNRAHDYFYYSQGLENSGKDMTVIDEFFELNISIFFKWYNYIFDDARKDGVSYYTLHGSKGLEFDNVVVVLQDNFAKKTDYCKFFFENYNTKFASDTQSQKAAAQFQKVRNLLYVAFSRAKINLYVIYKNNSSEDLPENIKEILGEALTFK